MEELFDELFAEDTYEKIKAYTIQFLTENNMYQFKKERFLSEKDIFEPGQDIFINLHLPQANMDRKLLHGHDFFELNYVIKGSCIQLIDDSEPLLLREGTLCIMNPKARHNIYVEDENSIVLNILLKTTLFNTTFWPLVQETEYIGSFFLSYFMSQDTSSHFSIYHTENPPSIKAMLNHMCTEYLERGIYYKVSIRSILLLFFTQVVRSSVIEISQQQFTDKVSVQITALFSYLSLNYATATLASTAQYFHYHPNYLSAFVKKHTGKTFRAILNDIKLSYANYYLTSTNLSINEISERLGFQQLCNFYDFIRKNHGMTPGEYRKIHNSF